MQNDDDGQGTQTPARLGRRGVLECMTWAGTAMVWTMVGGVPRARLIGSAEAATKDFSFVQVSDSHLGFDKPVNPDTSGTFGQALKAVTEVPGQPRFLIHTGDITHLSQPAQFDLAAQLLTTVKLHTYTVPGEHDVLEDEGKSWMNRYGKQEGAKGDGWYSFNDGGVHFIGLVNVMNLQGNGLGALGNDQLEWLEKDVAGLTASTPIVLFAHVPLWTVYADWGWGTADGAQALTYLKKFGSVTVLNGHIHQVMQKVEGHVAFHTARSTAFPQPVPGTAKGPGPMAVPPGQLRTYLGIAKVSMVALNTPLAIVDTPLMAEEIAMRNGFAPGDIARRGMLLATLRLAGGVALLGAATRVGAAKDGTEIGINNFKFAPTPLMVPKGATVTWVNRDDIPHSIVCQTLGFHSHPMDTDGSTSFTFDQAGRYEYVCGLHPFMRGEVIVQA